MSTTPAPDLPEEFSFIARHFKPLAGEGALALSDDAALLSPPPGRELVITADAMVAGVHFLPSDPPDLVGRKLLRVNLSDLAAKSATPLGYLLTLCLPKAYPDRWVAAFARGLGEDQAEFGVSLLGGDTTSTPGPLTLSVTMLGHVAPGTMVRRTGAQAGDGLWVTGTIGDGALGLAAAQGKLADPDGFLGDRYRLPRPRNALSLSGLAAAALDVSDGLVQDVGHLCRAAGLGCDIEAALVPLSDAARALGPGMLTRCLTGGDDYEIAFAVKPENEAVLAAASVACGVPVTRIGRFVDGDAQVRVFDSAGKRLRFAQPGWSHL